MQVGHQGLEALFIHETTEVTEVGGHDKNEDRGYRDDGYFDPFQSGYKGDGQQKDIAGKGDKEDDKEAVLAVEGIGDVFIPDREENDENEDSGEGPPE